MEEISLVSAMTCFNDILYFLAMRNHRKQSVPSMYDIKEGLKGKHKPRRVGDVMTDIVKTKLVDKGTRTKVVLPDGTEKFPTPYTITPMGKEYIRQQPGNNYMYCRNDDEVHKIMKKYHFNGTKFEVFQYLKERDPDPQDVVEVARAASPRMECYVDDTNPEDVKVTTLFELYLGAMVELEIVEYVEGNKIQLNKKTCFAFRDGLRRDEQQEQGEPGEEDGEQEEGEQENEDKD